MIAFDLTFTGLDNARAAMNGVQANAQRVIGRQVKKAAVEMVGAIKRGIRNQFPGGGDELKPLAESTILMKKSSKALINHGDLVRSVNATDIGGSFSGQTTAWFVGVHRSARGKSGKPMANIAEIHEFGTDPYPIRVTNKMRRFMMAMFIAGRMRYPISPSTTIINHPGVPARPFVRPPFEYWEKRGGPEQLAKDIARELGFGSAFGG